MDYSLIIDPTSGQQEPQGECPKFMGQVELQNNS